MTGLSLRSSGQPRKPLRARSKKRASEERTYARLREHFLDGAYCAVCSTPNGLTVHHQAGRRGELLCRMELWLPVCWPCHTRITVEPLWAVENGYSLSRTAVE